MSINTHERKGVTGPYHIIQSLEKVLEDYDAKVYAIKTTKKIYGYFFLII